MHHHPKTMFLLEVSLSMIGITFWNSETKENLCSENKREYHFWIKTWRDNISTFSKQKLIKFRIMHVRSDFLLFVWCYTCLFFLVSLLFGHSSAERGPPLTTEANWTGAYILYTEFDLCFLRDKWTHYTTTNIVYVVIVTLLHACKQVHGTW